MEQRIIKFKAKCLNRDEWITGDLLHKGNKTYIYYPRINDRGFWVENEEVDPSTVCQFTGIFDKYNKEIFENDLIQITQTKEVYVLIWNPIYCYYSFLDKEGNFYVGESFAEHHSRDMLIVGNKFDRKEEK